MLYLHHAQTQICAIDSQHSTVCAQFGAQWAQCGLFQTDDLRQISKEKIAKTRDWAKLRHFCADLRFRRDFVRHLETLDEYPGSQCLHVLAGCAP